MKRIYLSIILLSIVLVYEKPYLRNISAQPKTITIDDIELPSVKIINMKNGLRVFYIKDELPRLIIVLSAGFGKIYEDNTNAGISELIARTLTLAGSKKYPADVLHDTLEKIGGRFSVDSSWEETTITIEVLQKYSDTAFDILRDIVAEPNLDPGIIENARSLLLEDVRRKKDDPATTGFEKAREIIFNGTGYGSTVTEKSLGSISKNDIINMLGSYFTAKNMLMGISTSLSYNEIEKDTAVFDSLKAGKRMDYTVDLKSISASVSGKSKNIYLLPKDLPQAILIVGTVAPDIKDNRIYPLTMMNDILGGSDFNSRLMREIRVNRGLAYDVQSVIRFRKNTGVFLAYSQTRNESADTALSLMLENIDEMSKSAVKGEELKLAKDSIRNSYIFEFETPVGILKEYAFLSYNGLSESFLLQYIKNMENVSEVEIQKSSRELFGKGLIKVIIGKKELADKLGRFGNVIIIDEL